MSRQVNLEVVWAIRDSRSLNASEKSLLWAVESRGVHYGTWETVAADAGMKRDAYYRWRRGLEARGVLSVTERPGKTTLHEVNGEWFAKTDRPEIANDPSGDTVKTRAENRKHPSGHAVMEEDSKGDPCKGSQKNPMPTSPNRIEGPIYMRLAKPQEMSTAEKHAIGELSTSQRAEWDKRIIEEAILP